MRKAWLAALVLTLSPVAASAEAPAKPPEAAIALAERVADWELARLAEADAAAGPKTGDASPRSWLRGAFWLGVTRLADQTHAPKYREAVLAMGRANGWATDGRPYHADAYAITQSYLWAAKHGAGPQARGPTRAAFDRILAAPPRVGLAWYDPPEGYEQVECLKRWCWIDALFMAPPAWLEISRQTGDPRYARFALAETRATMDFLYDPAERLFYRDSRFFERRDPAGRKVFWARGEGWAFAAMANMLPMLDARDPDRAHMVRVFQDMAARLKALQKPDGYWPPSLLAPENSPPETSGTGLFVYGLAWGVEHGLLDRAEYEPTIRRGWAALGRAVAPDGGLGWVQRVGDRPDQVSEADTQPFGVGAFLLAACAVADLDSGRRSR